MCDLRAVLVALYHGVPSLHFVFQVRSGNIPQHGIPHGAVA
jgi:hypothetical protein